VSDGHLLEFSVGKQNAVKQRTYEVSLADKGKTTELRTGVWGTNHAAPMKEMILLQRDGSRKTENNKTNYTRSQIQQNNTLTMLITKLHSLSPRANYTDRAKAACQ
jgi:hypothetical protein